LENVMEARNLVASSAVGVLFGCLLGMGAARADHQPVIAVPGNWQVPVVINGEDATMAVVEGDWGLYAPGRVAPTIIGPVLVPLWPNERGYFPKTGRRPRYGRQEVVAPRYLPPAAPSFYREWSAQPGRGPVTEYPPFDPPPVIMAPRVRR